MFKVDLHVHSRYSGDNDSDPEEIIERAIARGLQGIAFTEHYYYEASEVIEPLRVKYNKSITLIRGVEFSAAEGHCLVFGVDTDKVAEKHLDIERLIDLVVSMGGVVIPTHPYRGFNSLGDELFKLSGIVALEGFNGCNMPAHNNRALEAAKRLGIPFTGGSDAHTPSDTGNCHTIFQEPVNQENIAQVIRNGNFTAQDNRRFARLMNYIHGKS